MSVAPSHDFLFVYLDYKACIHGLPCLMALYYLVPLRISTGKYSVFQIRFLLQKEFAVGGGVKVCEWVTVVRIKIEPMSSLIHHFSSSLEDTAL